jgi:hypothetical protein
MGGPVSRREVAAWGLLLALAGALAWGRAELNAPAPRGPLLSDVEGALEELEVHFNAAAAPYVLPTYVDLFRALPSATRVTVVVSRREDYDALCSALLREGVAVDRLRALVVDHDVSTWARDRFVPRTDGARTTLLVPRAPTDDSSLERRGDWFVAWDLAEHRDAIRVETLPLRFDGGDVVATRTTLFCDANLVAKNVPAVYPDRPALLAALQDLSGLKVELIGERAGDVPLHHIGMYLSPLADGSVAVADPRFRGLDPQREAARLRALGLPTQRNPEVERQCEFVADWLTKRGYRVRRLPFFPCDDPKVFVTYDNVLQEVRADGPHVYLPTYGVEWDERAAAVWRAAGYRVHPVDVRKIFVHRGSVRCLTQVLRRG